MMTLQCPSGNRIRGFSCALFNAMTLLVLAFTVSASLLAREHRQHRIHEHGVSRLNLGQEGTEIHVELESPAANIVGFEHAPSTEAEREALEQAIATLRDGERLFRFSDGAACHLVEARVETPLTDDGGVKRHERRKHDRHEAKHEPADEQHHGSHSHAEAQQGRKERPEDRAKTHANITAEYHFNCAQPEKLKQVDVALFQTFKETERLEVQFIIESRQGRARLTASSPVLKF